MTMVQQPGIDLFLALRSIRRGRCCALLALGTPHQGTGPPAFPGHKRTP